MKKNIAFIFPVSRKMGIFQYMLSITEAMANYCIDFDYTVLYFGSNSPKNYLKVNNMEVVKFLSIDGKPNNIIGKLKTIANILISRPIFVIKKSNKETLKKNKIDLLITPSPLLFGFENNIPYIVPIPDMMYKYYPNFPEYSFWNRIISQIVFKYSAKYAALCIADSTWGKNDIKKFLNKSDDQINVIPFLPAGYVHNYKNMTKEEADYILKKFKLPEKFVFYPAQFWAHKNHINLIKSIKAAEEKHGQKIQLVLVGDDKANAENYKELMDLAKSFGIKDRIIHLGYVSDEEIVALYKKATALVFASVGGPTNIPIVEAMFLGTPVVCPNLFAMPEQKGVAGVFFDPFNQDDMAEKISKVWQDEILRQQMIQKGYEKVENFTFEIYADQWIAAVKKALENEKINR